MARGRGGVGLVPPCVCGDARCWKEGGGEREEGDDGRDVDGREYGVGLAGMGEKVTG